jgi:hypothetical protein
MIKRTIKPAAGNSRITLEEATSAARVVYKDRATGRLIILEPDESLPARKSGDRIRASIKRTLGERKVSGSSRRESKKR